MKNTAHNGNRVSYRGGYRGGEASPRRSFGLGALAMPAVFTGIAGGAGAAYGALSLVELALLALAAVCLQMLGILSRQLGDIVDSEKQRTEYYERKFAQYKRMGRGLDPAAGTAGDPRTATLGYMIAACCAVCLVCGYALAFLCFGMQRIEAAWMAVALHSLLVVLVMLGFLGTWKYRYRPYGQVIVFALSAAAALGCCYMLLGRLVAPAVYAAIACGAAAVALANIEDIARQDSDTRLERSTLPIAARPRHAVLVERVCPLLAAVWLIAFPLSLGMPLGARYAFALMAVPVAMAACSAAPESEKLARSMQRALRVSLALLALAFLVSMVAGDPAALLQ